jgi:acyl-CoA synthetase (AMP-forming)/AMP-acid ligase II/thioesterase domain-containing protein/NADP-dependent 3-hydroxy acid dehydrogenase YdfG
MTPMDQTESQADRIANLSVAQLRLLGKRSKERSAASENFFKRRDPNANIFPLSFAQEGFWFLEQLMPRNPSFNWIMALRFHVSLEDEVWRDIFEELARRHEILRTRYVVQNGSPVQIVDAPTQVPVRIVNLRNLEVSQQQAAVTRFIDEESGRGFDIEKEVLCRFNILQLGADHCVLCSSTHLSIIDAWCRKVFMTELISIARCRLLSSPPHPEPQLQYGDYAAWERKAMQGKALERLLSYWKKQLQDMPDLELPTDYRRPAIQRLNGGMESVLLPKRLTDAVKEMGRSEGATPFMTFLAVFQIFLMLYSSQNDIAVGVPVVNRTSAELEGLLGRFVNTLVLRSRLRVSQTFREVLRHVREVTLAGMVHQDLPFELLVRELRVRREPDRNPLVRVMFQLEDIPATGLSTGGLIDSSMITPIEVQTGASVWDLNLHIFSDWDKSVLDRPEELRAVLYYDRELFDRSTISRMLSQYQTLLDCFVRSPEKAISEVRLVSDEELLCLESSSQCPVPELQHPTYPEAFQAQVAQYPNSIAVVDDDRELSYGELNKSANQLVSYLQSIGIRSPDTVAVCLESCTDLAIALLAILKTGASFVLLSPEDPQRRWQTILEDAKPATVLTHESLQSRVAGFKMQVVVLDQMWLRMESEGGDNLPNVVAGSPAYIHYHFQTRIPETHGGLLARLQWLQKEVQLETKDGVLQRSPLNHDNAICEILWPLAFGARLIATGKEGKGNAALWELIRKHQITVLYAASRELADLANGCPADAPNLLRVVLCSGELPRLPTLRAFFTNVHCPLWHLYAPAIAATEVAVARFYDHDPAAWWRPVSEPTGNARIQVLNESLKPLPVGVTGQVYIERSKMGERGEFESQQGLSATGDLARLHEAGNLELVGCTGDRGWVGNHQILFAEIAAALLQEASVADCAVGVRRDSDLENQLVAYVVASGQWAPQSLHRHLQALLPQQVLPEAYIPVARIPLTQEGDVDWQQLEAVEVIDSHLLSKWEQNLRNISGIGQLAVVAKDETPDEEDGLKRLHLSDLLPASTYLGTCAVTGVKDVKNDQHNAPTLQDANAGEIQEKALSISDGGPMPMPPGMPALLREILEHAASRYPDHGALYIGSDGNEQTQSYAEIFDHACRILGGLKTAGLHPGDRVILQLEKNQDFVQAFWACVLGGIVPVLISVPTTYAHANAVTTKLTNAWQILDQPLILANQDMNPSITSFAHDFGLDRFRLEPIETLLSFAPDRRMHVGQTDDPALLLLTSGSTGRPKIVPLSHRNILTRAAAVTARHGFSPAETSLNWMPLDHVGGIVMFHLQDVYLGCRQIHVETEVITRSPLTWLELIDQHRATITWAPNFAYAMVNSRAHEIALHHWDLSSMRFILNAGEAIVPRTAKKFMELLEPFGLPKSAMRPAWGMSETSSAVTYSDQFFAETTDGTAPFVEVGTPNPGFRVRIVGDDNEVLEEGKVGRLQVAGTSVTRGYLERDDLNSELFHDGGWFETGDVGYLRGRRLTITGRRKDTIIVNGVNCHCHEIEAIVEEIEGVEVAYTAACPVRSPHADTDQLAIFFNPSAKGNPVELIRHIRARVAQRAGISPEYLIPVQKEDIPRTSIGKIQRSLMKERFESGAFNTVLRELDLKLGNSNTLPDWFYRKSWRPRKAASLRDSLRKGTWLLFMDQVEMGVRLHNELTRLECSTITVEIGCEFARIGGRKYRIQPDNHEHYQRLFEELAREGVIPREIVHLWTYAPTQENSPDLVTFEDRLARLATGAYSLLHIIQQIAGRVHEPLGLTVVSSNSQAAPGKKDLFYDRAALRGLLKAAKLEVPLLQCRHIDLPMESVDNEAKLLLEELRLSQPDIEVFYAGLVRMVPQLDKVSFNVQDRKNLPFKRNGMYLMSGGLGGIGSALAKYLLTQCGSRLLLLGRTHLFDRVSEEGVLGSRDLVERRLQAYRALEQAGDVCYEAVDVCDASAVADAVGRAEAKWHQPLDGVIHLAGTSTDRLLLEESKDSLAVVLRTKLRGAQILSELIGSNPEAVFITASSATTLWGTVGMATYCSANEALECFTRYQQFHGIRSYCFSWSVWDGIGMSREYQLQSAYRMRGMFPISTNQGINSFLVGLCRDQKELIVGLDSNNFQVRRWMETEACERQRIYAYFAANSSVSVEQFKSWVVTDRFKTRTVCRPVQLKELPLTEEGKINRIKLSMRGFLGVEERDLAAPPMTEIERQIAEIWKGVLGTAQVGVHDDFFALGGHSMLAVQVMATIRARLSKDLPLRIFLEKPTVAHLAAALQTSPGSERPSPLVPIQENGARRPLFMAHPAGGNVLCYQALATELGPDQPLYGLEEAGDGMKEGLAKSLEEMATRYCHAIRDVQPMGPYLLGGWSLGGVIAFEMARQLHQQGEEVLLLAILDVEAPERSHAPALNRRKDSAEALLALCKMLEIYTCKTVPVSQEDLESRSAEEQVEYVFYRMQSRDLLPVVVDLDYFKRYVQIYQGNLEAMARYTPRQYDGKIVVFRSAETLPGIAMEHPRTDDPKMGWQKYSVAPIAVHHVPGNHITMMTSPRVGLLAAMLQNYLNVKCESNRTIG